jgi:hypothetical protein
MLHFNNDRAIVTPKSINADLGVMSACHFWASTGRLQTCQRYIAAEWSEWDE